MSADSQPLDQKLLDEKQEELDKVTTDIEKDTFGMRGSMKPIAESATTAKEAVKSAAQAVNDNFEKMMGTDVKDRIHIDHLWARVQHPGGGAVFFRDLKFDSEAGFNAVPDLVNVKKEGGQSWTARTVWAIVAIFFAVYNTRFILLNDLVPCGDHLHAEDNKGKWLLTSQILGKINRAIDWSGDLVGQGEAADEVQKRLYECGAVWFIHAIELLMLGVVYLRMFRNMILALTKQRSCFKGLKCREPVEIARWTSLCNIFWRNIPDLGAISGMRVLAIFQGSQLTFEINNLTSDKVTKKEIFIFIVKIVACFVYGIDCFLVKYRMVLPEIQSGPEPDWFNYIGQITVPLIFARQLASVVDIPHLVYERLFVFVFGGEDSVMQSPERAKRDVWNAMMVKRFWEYCFEDKSCWGRLQGMYRFTILMLSWSDYDFQMLVLDVDEEAIKKRHEMNRSLGLLDETPTVKEDADVVKVEEKTSSSWF